MVSLSTEQFPSLHGRLEEAHNHTYLPFSNLSQATKGKLQTSYTILCWCLPILSALGIGAAVASLSGHADSASDALHDTSGAVSHCLLAQSGGTRNAELPII